MCLHSTPPFPPNLLWPSLIPTSPSSGSPISVIAAPASIPTILFISNGTGTSQVNSHSRQGYCKHNPGKMELNLIRMHQAGVRCPEPIILHSHVLSMSLIGKDGWPVPLLTLFESKAREVDSSLCVTTNYRKYRLVHADLSEFSILYHEGRLRIQEFSQ